MLFNLSILLGAFLNHKCKDKQLKPSNKQFISTSLILRQTSNTKKENKYFSIKTIL